MKKYFGIFIVITMMVTLVLSAFAADTWVVGSDIKLGGILKTLKIRTIALHDPGNPFVTIYMTQSIAGGIALADPSNNSVAARLTGKVPIDINGTQVIDKSTDLELFKTKKSVLAKNLHIARFYDPIENVLVYITYSRKLIDGSAKHSMSVVPLRKVK